MSVLGIDCHRSSFLRKWWEGGPEEEERQGFRCSGFAVTRS